MERRPRKGFSRLDRKKSSESATQQYRVADVDPLIIMMCLKLDIDNTQLNLQGQVKKWSVKFGTRSAPVSPKDTSDLNAGEGQHITQQVLQTALEHERRLGRRSEGLYRTRSDWGLYEEILPDTPILPSPSGDIV